MLFEITAQTLYCRDVRGNIREWSIWAEGNTIFIEYGLLKGAKQIQTEEIKRGKGGRSLQQQLLSRINSRINNQKLKGYKETLEEALDGKSNALGYQPPMLAQRLDRVRISLEDSFVQRKYDGFRAIILGTQEGPVAYTRRGKLITTIDHITSKLDLQPGECLDGELYHHGYSLQQIASLVKRKQPLTETIQYHIYDVMQDTAYINRLKWLEKKVPDLLVETWPIESINLQSKFREVRDEGYEGLIIRLNTAGYEAGKRSKSLLKMKETQDAEFLVIDIFKSEKGRVLVLCETPAGKQFKVRPPGSMQEQEEVFLNKENYINTYLTVEYAELTPYGIPFHPVAIAWRNYE